MAITHIHDMGQGTTSPNARRQAALDIHAIWPRFRKSMLELLVDV